MESSQQTNLIDLLSLIVGCLSLILAWLAASFFSMRSEMRALVHSSQRQLDRLRNGFVRSHQADSDQPINNQDMLHVLSRLKHELTLIEKLSHGKIEYVGKLGLLRKKITSDKLMSVSMRKDEKKFVIDVMNDVEEIYQGLDKAFWTMYQGRNLTVSVAKHAFSMFFSETQKAARKNS